MSLFEKSQRQFLNPRNLDVSALEAPWTWNFSSLKLESTCLYGKTLVDVEFKVVLAFGGPVAAFVPLNRKILLRTLQLLNKVEKHVQAIFIEFWVAVFSVKEVSTISTSAYSIVAQSADNDIVLHVCFFSKLFESCLEEVGFHSMRCRGDSPRYHHDADMFLSVQ